MGLAGGLETLPGQLAQALYKPFYRRKEGGKEWTEAVSLCWLWEGPALGGQGQPRSCLSSGGPPFTIASVVLLLPLPMQRASKYPCRRSGEAQTLRHFPIVRQDVPSHLFFLCPRFPPPN